MPGTATSRCACWLTRSSSSRAWPPVTKKPPVKRGFRARPDPAYGAGGKERTARHGRAGRTEEGLPARVVDMERGASSTRCPLPEGASGHQTRSQRRASTRGSRRAEYHDSLCAEGAPLTDEEWEMVEPLLPHKPPAGRPYNDHRTVLGGIMWVARTGSSWPEMPKEFGKWESAYPDATSCG